MREVIHATRLVLYARKSTDREDKQMRSIDDQLKLAREEARKLGISLVEEFVEAKSAKNPGEREIFQEMVQFIREGKADGILSWHPDRLARNSVDGGWVIDLLDRKFLKNLYFLSYYFDNSPEGKMALSMVFSQAKYQVDKISVDVSRGIVEMRAEGGWPFKAPEGYKNVRLDSGKKAVIPDPERFPLLRRAIDLILSEVYTVADARRHLNAWGYQRRATKKYPSSPITEGAWYRLLNNPFYMGQCRNKGQLYQGVHQPLLTAQEFRTLQKLIGRKDIPMQRKHTYAYARGLLTCGRCGCQITASLAKGKHRRGAWIYYHCTNRKGICDRRGIREDVLETAFREQIQRISIPKSLLPLLSEIAEQSISVAEVASATTATSTESRLIKARAERSRLVRLLAQDVLQPEDFRPEKAKLDEEIFGLEERLHSADRSATLTRETVENVLSFSAHALRTFDNGSPELKRRVIQLMSVSRVQTPEKVLLEPHPYLQGFRNLAAQTGEFKPPKSGFHSTKIPPSEEVLLLGRPNENRKKQLKRLVDAHSLCADAVGELLAAIRNRGEVFPGLELSGSSTSPFRPTGGTAPRYAAAAPLIPGRKGGHR